MEEPQEQAQATPREQERQSVREAGQKHRLGLQFLQYDLRCITPS